MNRPILVNILLVGVLLLSTMGYSEAVAQGGKTYYISPSGDDSRLGTSEAEAWRTFVRALNQDAPGSPLQPGDTLIVMDGIYHESIRPHHVSGQPGNPITVRAQHDGKAIIDGQGVRIPVHFEEWRNASYFVVEGIVARNSSESVFQITGDHNVFRRVSGYNANTNANEHVFTIWADDNLLEDCVAAGTGRKMIMVYQGNDNVIRRCLAYWQGWDGRNFCGVTWPNGQAIQVYHGRNNIIENSIGYGPVPDASISVQANDPSAIAIGNKVLGSIAIGAGMNPDGTVKQWGNTRPGPTACPDMLTSFDWPDRRSGFSLHGSGTVQDNLFQDILSWGNAGLGLVEELTGVHSNNRIIRTSIFNNGLDNPEGPWPGKYGGVDTDVLQEELNEFDSVQDSSIEKIFVSWPNYPNGQRVLTSLDGQGAQLSHRYVNGVLTNQPLWPWPMEERIQSELGFSVTDLVNGILGQAPDFGFTLTVSPQVQGVKSGGGAAYTAQIQHGRDFTSTVTLQTGPSPSPNLAINPPSSQFDYPGGNTVITLTDLHDSSFSSSLYYTVPVIATGGGITRTTSIKLLVNGTSVYLPIVNP